MHYVFFARKDREISFNWILNIKNKGFKFGRIDNMSFDIFKKKKDRMSLTSFLLNLLNSHFTVHYLLIQKQSMVIHLVKDYFRKICKIIV